MKLDKLTYDLLLEEMDFRRKCRTGAAEERLERLEQALNEAERERIIQYQPRD